MRCARFSCDSKKIASASDDKCIKLFDRRSKECIHTYTEMKGKGLISKKTLFLFFIVNKFFVLGSPRKVAFHPSDTCIATALTNNSIKFYDLRIHKQLQLYKCHAGEVNSVEFHPDGNYLYSVSSDGTMKVSLFFFSFK